MKNNIIPFDSHSRLLEKAGRYLENLELFLAERDQAVPLLLKALKLADRRVKHRIVLLLGGIARQQITEPLYAMMTDPHEDDDVRHDAAIQLSVTMPLQQHPDPLVNRLLKDLKSSDVQLRANAAFALGWEGNRRAAIPLIECLGDPDAQVQQAAVNALTNLQEDGILDLLIERMETAAGEQRRAILFNLWRFFSRREAVTGVYLRYLEHPDEELRFDALVLLGTVADVGDHLPVYRRCLGDRSASVRELAYKALSELPSQTLAELRDEIVAGMNDPDVKVKQAALKLHKRIRH
jgi:HEAT repeat protein